MKHALAGGVLAVLDQNLIVTYGGLPPTPPAVQVTNGGDTTADDQNTANLNNLSDINSGPETQGDAGTGTPEEKEKKALSVCK